MANIFISYSSEDEKFARKLAEDLIKLGHEPWFDKWEIKVGECIQSKIEHGVSEADYVIIILSPSSVESTWVEKEWKIKYWDEIERNETLVLPVLIENCEIPSLLKIKKYADFRTNYPIGLVDLASSINPVIKKAPELEEIKSTDYSSDISTLLNKIHSREVPLSQCITKALEIARKVNDPSLKWFCENELKGWTKEKLDEYPNEKLTYRLIEEFVSLTKINLQYGWGNVSNIIDYMRNNSTEFIPKKTLMAHPVSEIESMTLDDIKTQILIKTMKLRDFVPKAKTPDVPLHVYARGDICISVLESIRAELTKRLIDLYPE